MLLLALLAAVGPAAGCGTTRWTDTQRTATEQLLISTAIDRSINNIDFAPLAGKDVYLDPQYLAGTIDEKYVVSSLRQHLLAYGCTLHAKAEEAEYVVEARAGTVGTDRTDLLIGVPATQLPSVTGYPTMPTAIPEIALAKTSQQRGVAKIAVFAYHRETGLAVWQSGAFPVMATVRASWVLGSGPFERGSIYDGTQFAGSRLILGRNVNEPPVAKPDVPVTAEAVFTDDARLARATAGDSAAAAPAPAADATVPASAVPADAVPVETTPPPPAMAGPAPPDGESVIPAGRIVRLPAAEARERPDLAESHDGSAPHDGTEMPAPEPPPEEREAFNLLSPTTWFQ
jgi:hypothetical protein